MNIAMIVAASDYPNIGKPLPACKNDAEIFKKICEKSGRFSEIYVSISQESHLVKRDIAEIINKHEKEEIEEIVFYFSGHGEFKDDEMYLILNDYQNSRLRTTPISGTELDDQIRSLNPKVFTKIIDACYSGVQYMKDLETLEDKLARDKGKFKKVYYWFSSEQDQKSYAEGFLSDFTASLFKAIRDSSLGPLRHRDIMAAIADDFEANKKQKPVFVTQSNYTDVFLNVSDDLRNEAIAAVGSNSAISNSVKDNNYNASSLSERIKEDAQRYASKEEADKIISSMKPLFEKPLLSTDIEELYDVTINWVSDEIPNNKQIGEWINKNDKEKSYFADVNFKLEKYQKKVPNWSTGVGVSALSRFLDPEHQGHSLVNDVRTVVAGFKHTNRMDFTYGSIHVKPKYPNLTPGEGLVVPILSRTELRIFWTWVNFKYIDWEEWERDYNINWETDACSIKDMAFLEELAAKILERFRIFIEKPLRKKWMAADGGAEVTDDGSKPQ